MHTLRCSKPTARNLSCGHKDMQHGDFATMKNLSACQQETGDITVHP